MKRLIALLLTLALAVGLVACSGSGKAAETTAAPDTTTAAASGDTTAAAATAAETAAASASAPASEEEAAKLRDAGTLQADPKTGYDYSDSTGYWYYSNYPNYKDFKEDGAVKVAFVCKFSGAWFTPKQEALGKACKDAGYTYQYIDANSDEQAWLDGIQTIINQDFDAVVMTPVNTALLPDAIADLQDAGIAYLTTDDPGADVNGFYSPHYGLDDYKLFVSLGEEVVKKMKADNFMDGVKPDYSNFLFVLLDSPSVEAIHKRSQGYYDAIKAAYPDIPEDRIIWADCGGGLTDDITNRLSPLLQANVGTVDKWIIGSGTGSSPIADTTLLKEAGVDLKNVIISDCIATEDVLDAMDSDEGIKNAFVLGGLVSAPSGEGMGRIIKDLVENGTPIPCFTGYDFIPVEASTYQDFRAKYF